MSYQVKHYMSEEVPTIEGRASVAEAAREMSKADKGFLIILKDGRPTGMVTLRDIVNKVVATELDSAKVSVEEIMSSPLITVDPDEDLIKASNLLKEKNIRQVAVVKDEIIYGVLTAGIISQRFAEYLDKSTRDIMRWFTLL
jgi:CBS domain-containing protein